MTVLEFLDAYVGSVCISIERKNDEKMYCEEEYYDYYKAEVDEDLLSENNPNHYKPKWIGNEAWWNEVKDKEVVKWNVICGEGYKTEVWLCFVD